MALNSLMHIHCVRKEMRPTCFLWYLLQNSGDSGEIWCTFSWIDLLQNYVNNFYLTRIMSSTLPCETWNAQRWCATIELLQKETPEFIPLQLWPSNSPDLNPFDNNVLDYCKRRCTKYVSLIWTNWNSNWERSGPSWIMSLLRQPFVGGIVDSSRSVMFCTPPLAIFLTRCY